MLGLDCRIGLGQGAMEWFLNTGMSADSHQWSPDWAMLWRFGACWAGRPIPGLLLPGGERLKITTGALEQLMASHPALPAALQTHAFIQSAVVRIALGATRVARMAPVHTRGDPG
jgi:hypothetical protein